MSSSVWGRPEREGGQEAGSWEEKDREDRAKRGGCQGSREPSSRLRSPPGLRSPAARLCPGRHMRGRMIPGLGDPDSSGLRPFEVGLVLSPLSSASKAALPWSGHARLYR